MDGAVCRCTGLCKRKPPSPKFQWKQQSEMAERSKHMAAELTAAVLAHFWGGVHSAM